MSDAKSDWSISAALFAEVDKFGGDQLRESLKGRDGCIRPHWVLGGLKGRMNVRGFLNGFLNGFLIRT